MPEFDVIVADCPWSYQNWTDAKNGAAVSAMRVQAEAFLASIPVAQWAAKDCVLLSWFTWPKMLEGECSRVMQAWGFQGVTGAPWIKTLPKKGDIATGIGFWFQSCSEPLTVWKRGNPTTERFPILGLLHGDERQYYYPASRKHSRKPEDIYDWIETKCGPPGDGTNGTTRYLELFATRPRPGWTCWGADLGYWLDAQGVHAMDLPPPPPPPQDEWLPPPPPPPLELPSREYIHSVMMARSAEIQQQDLPPPPPPPERTTSAKLRALDAFLEQHAQKHQAPRGDW